MFMLFSYVKSWCFILIKLLLQKVNLVNLHQLQKVISVEATKPLLFAKNHFNLRLPPLLMYLPGTLAVQPLGRCSTELLNFTVS